MPRRSAFNRTKGSVKDDELFIVRKGWRIRAERRFCEACGTPFVRIRAERGRFCSLLCAIKSQPPCSDEKRLKCAAINKGRKQSEAVIEARRERQRGRIASPETRKTMSRSQRGKHAYLFAPDVVAKMTATRRSQVEFNREQGIRRCRQWFTYEWLDRAGRLWRFKSSWELRFAQGIDRLDLTWSYEPCALLLSNGRTYLPDFWIVEWKTYVEIKAPRGRWGISNRTKPTLAISDGHPIKLLMSLQEIDRAISVDNINGAYPGSASTVESPHEMVKEN